MYRTELMDEILKSPMAQKMVQMVSPIYGKAYTVLWLYQIIGTVMDNLDEWTGSLQDQVVPQTATWSLPYWEDQYGIASEESWTYERRRQNIINRCRSRAPMNPHKLSEIISVASGADARIEELTGKNHFTVYISENAENVDEDFVKTEIDKAKPAHLIYDIKYEQHVNGELYIGGIIQTAREVTLTHYY